MPIHIVPALRAREEAEEAGGLIPKLNSVAVTEALTAEAAGLVKKVVPVATTYVGINGTNYTAK